MNILVIGNGFDIAHGLKTSYRDFLTFVNSFSDYVDAQKDKRQLTWGDDEDTTYFEWIINLFKEAKANEIYSDFIEEFHSLIKDNLWIGHFNEVSIENRWVDFEKEISRVIQVIDSARRTHKIPHNKNTGHFNSKIEEYALKVVHPSYRDGITELGIRTFLEFKGRLLQDLNRVERSLELYLTYYVESEQVKGVDLRLPIISKLQIDRLLSFNYTNTYERLYGNENTKYNYIHGKARKDSSIDSCNIVLGIDEYLDDSTKDSDNEFIEFKKFYQRIFKRTGSEYKSWLESINSYWEKRPTAIPTSINIYFYGHSLDVTDKDIIYDLIMCKNVVTTIFYHDKEALGSQIANLVKIIGEDRLIEKTGDYNPSIIFKDIEE